MIEEETPWWQQFSGVPTTKAMTAGKQVCCCDEDDARDGWDYCILNENDDPKTVKCKTSSFLCGTTTDIGTCMPSQREMIEAGCDGKRYTLYRPPAWFIETAENAFAKKKKVHADDEQFQEMTSGSETAELGNRVAALELAMRKQNDVLQKILAATAAK